MGLSTARKTMRTILRHIVPNVPLPSWGYVCTRTHCHSHIVKVTMSQSHCQRHSLEKWSAVPLWLQDTVNALKKAWHKQCFVCTECRQPISVGAFHVEDGNPYCIAGTL